MYLINVIILVMLSVIVSCSPLKRDSNKIVLALAERKNQSKNLILLSGNGNFNFNNSSNYIADTSLDSGMNSFIDVNSSANGLVRLAPLKQFDSNSSDFSGNYGTNAFLT